MAESLAALGVASNIVQFVELGFNITKAVIETYRSTDINGLAERNVDLVAMTASLKDRCTLLQDDAAAKADPITIGLLKRCIKVANELLFEVGGLKMSAADRHRSLAKFIVSVKAYWKKSKIEDLAARIVDVRKEIFRRLEPLLHDHHKSLSEAMRSLGEASTAWNNATEKRLDSIARDLERLLDSNSQGTSTEDFGVFANQLSKFADEAKHRGNIRTILKSLHFAQIKERQNEIPQAHRNMFQWIFDESSSAGFKSWFQCPSEGVFWITGKPGSGKSTLMKFILGHQTTKDLAKAWAGSKPLILISHFFWSVGNKIQKSQEGLLRTLLFQIMVQCPELIPEVCRERYSDPFRSLESWSLEELSEIFERIQHVQSLPNRILLLVDGLDEYNGEPRELTKFLGAIAKSPDIKVCCASRPWPDFLEAFGRSHWTLEIHNLTQNDIIRYAVDNLSNDATFRALRQAQKDESQDLVHAICDKAEGVFFWVSLVIKSLLRGLQNHDDLDILHKRLAEFPSDLQPFFQRMLDSIEDVYVDEAFWAFTILLSAKTSLPVRLFRHMGKVKGLEKPKPVESRFSQPKIFANRRKQTGPQSANARLNVILDTDPRWLQTQVLLSKCRDLVQAWDTGQNEERVGFLHRTVFEFLLQSSPLQQYRINIPIGQDCLFPMACLRDMHEHEDSITERNDSFLRICHFFQELETDNLPFQPYLWNGLFDLRSKSPFFYGPYSSQLVGHTVARFMLKLDASQKGTLTNSDFENIWTGILAGSVYVDVAECPEVTELDYINTELLADILDLYEKTLVNSREEFEHVWTAFVYNLSKIDTERPTPKNAIQACKMFVERGAPRYITSKLANQYRVQERRDDLSEEKDFDVLYRLLACERFEKAEVNEQGDLFPMERLPQSAITGFGQLWGWLISKPANKV
ncbi:Vegetative incompatibility protein HET-E-1 [Colletotrichum viniferum]|nr:Vegetative incompatibility protein HET-E-1 [Colletotrichum viniferum]